MTVLTILFAVGFAAAQGTNVVNCGEVRKLSVKDKPGNIFFWKIYTDKFLVTEVSTAEAEFIKGNTGSEVAVRWGIKGTYYFTVQSFNLSGCSNRKVGKMEVLTTSIIANAGIDTIIGSCQNIKLDGSGSTGEIVKYEWTTLDKGGTIENPECICTLFSISPHYAGGLPANFRVGLKVTDVSGNTDSDTLVVKTDIRPSAKIVYSDLIDKNGYKLADGSTSTGRKIVYKWAVENGSFSGDSNSEKIKVSIPGCYSLLVRDKYGCESSAAQKVSDIQNILRANADYARCTWDEDLMLPVISNDYSSSNNIKPESLEIAIKPSHGSVNVLNNGIIKYSPDPNYTGKDKFIYRISDGNNISDSTEVIIDVDDAPIAIPQGFSPNGDGLNDLLVFKGLENYPGSELIVFTKDGKVIFKGGNYQNDWSGKYSTGGSQSQTLINHGVYYYSLKMGLTNRIIKGFIYVAY
ncbi:MAG: gliding motility-associated C-terminal domain-containing protein [Mariniphaga sp.]